ncbi:MAG: hypothetical protein HYZ37_03060 [Candidatus Solibacter usitatus]|nr:hypothetical protein [Candidatus Solibacter usitatus]
MRTRRSFLAAALSVGVACRSTNADIGEVVNMADPGMESQLLRGFHLIEEGGWRWTQSKFAVALKPPRKSESGGAVLVVVYSVPDGSLAQLKEITISASINGLAVQEEKCSTGGRKEIRREVPGSALKGKDVALVEFSVSPFLAPTATDKRELGIIVLSVGLVKKA